MSYTVLARKYRPQTFADLVGQEHVTRTLSNAIETGRVAHAFLFTGVRGVGKTTSARILAKALNCERGPTPSPCNECDACVQITAGVDLDVLEIDGASNNGVDDVRRLQESLPYRPARDRFKVVIVDEVHMLTTGAFNAFLKTLEEPPAHVKFIFATTESHKVPITIRSRCQRYDFRLIPQPVIAEHVARILAAESLEADAHAIAIVAREAAGSMRDALTLLDQIVAFSGEKLVGNEVAQKLGLADREQLFAIAEAVLRGDAKRALEVIDAVASQGLDLGHFTRQWLDLLRDMVVLRVASDRPELVELPEDERTRAKAIADQQPLLELERAFAGVAKLIDEVSRSSAPRLLLEMGAVRLATRPPLQDLSELIARLARMESGGGAPAQPPQAAPPGRPPPPPSRGAEPPPTRSAAPDPRAMGARSDAPAKPNPFQRFIPPESNAAPTGMGEPLRPPSASAGTASQLAASVAPVAPASFAPSPPRPAAAPVPPTVSPISLVRANAQVAPPEPVAHAPVGTPAPRDRRPPPDEAPFPPLESAEPGPSRAAPPAPQPERSAAPSPSMPPATPPPPARAVSGPTPHLENWTRVCAELRKSDPRWSAMFEHGVPEALDGTRASIVFQEGSFFGRQAQSAGGIDALAHAVAAVFGATPEVQIRFAVELPGVSLAQREAAAVDERKEGLKRKALGHPRVIEAMKVFPELGQKQDVQVD